MLILFDIPRDLSTFGISGDFHRLSMRSRSVIAMRHPLNPYGLIMVTVVMLTSFFRQ